MSDTRSAFDKAVANTKRLTKKPSNETLLELYANFKQATEGDVTGERPGMFDPVGAAKFDAWEELAGLSKEEAMTRYVALVDRLLAEQAD